MTRLSRAEMIRLLIDLCGIPKPFLENMDTDTVQKLFEERLGGLQKEA
ncbi:hypothetical protein [Natribacillus halophilus]|uniref:Uncharacterized protein n=1 Tax=Natribacillus halophilus TaxID=549003 RepID=A0A1G8J734_9BACI|nr:hypothetical protein [Natribacillus halophilus]SDI26807.1 hypothetical protein SAMN04488123_10155 [Natribacillus halophilus]